MLLMPKGLSAQESQSLLKQYGLNQIREKASVQPFKILFAQLKSPFLLILLTAAIIAYFVSDILDSLVIISIVVINALFGFFQEFRAEKSLSALKKMVVTNVNVIRAGKEQTIETIYLVPGDIIVIAEGSKVPADAVLIESFNLEVDESSLTGESVPVVKELNDSENSEIYLGTTIVSGHAVAKVIATGMQTKFGKIAALLEGGEDEQTPLERQLGSLSKILAGVVVVLTATIFVYSLLNGRELLPMLFTSISLAVAVVPEGLPVVVTVTLAIGVQRMVKRKAIIRKLDSIETLGATNVICTDKTGTLTRNEMAVKHLWLGGEILSLEKIKKSEKLVKLLQIATVANNASVIVQSEQPNFSFSGDKTETALLDVTLKLGYEIENFRNEKEKVAEFTFDSHLKLMSVILNDKEGLQILTKGAPEEVLKNSDRILLENGKTRKLTAHEIKLINQKITQVAQKGERLLGFGYKPLRSKPAKRSEAETGLTFVGFVGISDPLRSEVRNAIQLAKEAGIRTIMITGDNPLTAQTIAREAGIFAENEEVVSGSQLSSMSEFELEEILRYVNVFARTTPFDKTRIVKALQRMDQIVAVTGDGVNDAPALKAANVGVAMAITGTDVAKEAADIVLTDDNYVSLVSAIEEGRVVYDNIVKSIKFLLSTNSSELILIIGSVVLNFPLPLTPFQILWINLVTDSLPALALATDPKDPYTMKKLPREKTKGIVEFINPLWVVKTGTLIAVAVLVIFLFIMEYYPLAQARMAAFNLLILLQLGVAFSLRKDQSWNSNQKLLWAVAIIFVVQTIILLNPTLTTFFNRG